MLFSRRCLAAVLVLLIAHHAIAVRLFAQRSPAGRVEGYVFDSVARRPITGAVVQLVTPDYRSSRATLTDSRGHFVADGLEPGQWVVAALHPRLDSMGIAQLSQGAVVVANRRTRVVLGVPSPSELIRRTCGASIDALTEGFLHGTLRSVGGEAGDGAIWVAWQEVLLGNDGRAQQAGSGIEARVDSSGRFLACGVPAGTRVMIRGWSGADSTGLLEYGMPASGIGTVHLLLGQNKFDAFASMESTRGASFQLLSGTGRIDGVARSTTGEPVVGAKVSVWSTRQETRSAADGRFQLQGLPVGSFTLEARAVGYAPLRQTVTLVPDSATRPELRFERNIVLDTLRVRAQRAPGASGDVTGFDARRRINVGRAKFFGPDELEKLNPLRISDALLQVPGVRVQAGGRISMRGAGFAQWCTPVVFLDGARLEGVGRLDALVDALVVRALEVYPSQVVTPQQFSSGMPGCGTIVLWTGSRR